MSESIHGCEGYQMTFGCKMNQNNVIIEEFSGNFLQKQGAQSTRKLEFDEC